jgi:hypothetical protein
MSRSPGLDRIAALNNLHEPGGIVDTAMWSEFHAAWNGGLRSSDMIQMKGSNGLQ